MSTHSPPLSSWLRRTSGHAFALALCAGLFGGGAACSHSPPPESPNATQRSPQQEIVEAAAGALTHMRDNSRFAAMEAPLEKARAVLIFPHVRKASLLLGGGGGSGVLVARGKDGTWSDPAFYSIGAPSVGIQIGYQEATVVLLVMDDETLTKVLRSDFTLSGNTGGGVGEASEHGRVANEVVSKSIEQFAEAGGAFVGVSLDGYVTQARDKHNAAYYGKAVTPRQILLEGVVHEPGADVLRGALGPRKAS